MDTDSALKIQYFFFFLNAKQIDGNCTQQNLMNTKSAQTKGGKWTESAQKYFLKGATSDNSVKPV